MRTRPCLQFPLGELVLGTPPQQTCVVAHFTWLRAHNQTDRMSQGQELWSHFKRLVMVVVGRVTWAFQKGFKMGKKTANIPWINWITGQGLEKGR